jgi:streptogramin lyase
VRLVRWIGGILGLSLAIAAGASAAPLGSINEFATGGTTAGFTANSGLNDIAEGPDGNLWATEGTGNRIARVSLAGTVTEFATGLSPMSTPNWITAGPDGNVWFTEMTGNHVGRITPQGAITEFFTGITSSSPQQIITGPDQNLWFMERGTPSKLARLNPASGHIDEYPLPTAASAGTGIAVGPDGNLWITESANPGRIARAVVSQLVPNTSSGITEVAVGGVTTGFTANTQPFGIAAGADGSMWITESFGAKVLRLTTGANMTATEFSVPAPTGFLNVIIPGPDGNLWLPDQGSPNARIVQLNPLTGVFNTFSAGLTGNSIPDGLALAPDGNIWFVELRDPGRIGTVGTGEAAALLTAPDVLGSAQQGQQQRCGGDRWASWAGEQPAQTGVKWLLDGAAIAGASAQTFTPPAADVGHALSCAITVSYSGLGVSASATSTAVTVVAPGQGPQGPPGHNGNPGPPGKQGPPGKIELIVCQTVTKVVHHKPRKVKKCTSRLVSSPVKFTTAVAKATLTRGGRTYASGTARVVHGVVHLQLAARRGLTRGRRYELTLRYGNGRVVRTTIVYA